MVRSLIDKKHSSWCSALPTNDETSSNLLNQNYFFIKIQFLFLGFRIRTKTKINRKNIEEKKKYYLG
jgi:hypothetical protein